MTTFVLVHGAWHGGWCWRRVVDRLEKQGHKVYAPTMTGVGDRAHLLTPQVTLQTHINDISRLIKWEGLSDVVLVGHSYGGMVITGVADAVADRVRTLIYVDALTPKHGQCALDIRSKERNAETLKLAREQGRGWQIPPTKAATFNVNEADQDWVDSHCTNMPLACFTQPLYLSGQGDAITDRVYIRAGGYPSDYFDAALHGAEADARFVTHTLGAGHDIMVDDPDGLTEILLQFPKG